MATFYDYMMAHFIADWIFQNEWIAVNKTNLRHPALYIHGFIHFVLIVALTGAIIPAIIIAVIHMVIDTRIPLMWWMNFYKQTTDGEYGTHTKIWLDQILHLVTIYLILRFNIG